LLCLTEWSSPCKLYFCVVHVCVCVCACICVCVLCVCSLQDISVPPLVLVVDGKEWPHPWTVSSQDGLLQVQVCMCVHAYACAIQYQKHTYWAEGNCSIRVYSINITWYGLVIENQLISLSGSGFWWI